MYSQSGLLETEREKEKKHRKEKLGGHDTGSDSGWTVAAEGGGDEKGKGGGGDGQRQSRKLKYM